MRYLSLFSGIEAASVAWEPLGWEPVAFCEVDAFPSAVLAHRWPHVPNLGDITKVDWNEYAKGKRKPDVVVGGSPCQSFSVAGSREGLAGESGLMFEYIRAVRGIMPRCFVWENVPGALSSEHGEAFRQLLSEMDALGYGLAWRVLDAQFFGVAQRRERVFLVGCLGDPRRAARVLFEPDGLRWDTPSSRDKRQELAARAGRGASGAGGAVAGFCAGNSAKASTIGYAVEQSPTLRAGESGTNMTPTVLTPKTLQIRCGCEGGGKGALVQDDMSATLSTSQVQTLFAPTYAARTANTGANGIGVSEEVAHALDTARPEAIAVQAFCLQGNMICRSDSAGPQGMGVNDDVAFTLTTNDLHAVATPVTQYGDVAGTLTARHDSSPCADRGANAVAAPVCLGDDNAKASCDVDMCGTLKVCGSAPIAAFQQNYVQMAYEVRRLMPVECERLQGFPDGHTDLTGANPDELFERMVREDMGEAERKRLRTKLRKWCGNCPDTPRYKACGNSMAVPVMRWIGERIERAEVPL